MLRPAAWAASTRAARSARLPWRVRPLVRLPARSWFPGHIPAHEARCRAVGKRASGRTRKGNRALRAALVEAAQAAGRSKRTYLGAQFRRLAARRGKKKAAVAVGHTILVIAYHLFTEGSVYQDLGPQFFDARDRRRVERRLVHRLEALGYKVALEAVAD